MTIRYRPGSVTKLLDSDRDRNMKPRLHSNAPNSHFPPQTSKRFPSHLDWNRASDTLTLFFSAKQQKAQIKMCPCVFRPTPPRYGGDYLWSLGYEGGFKRRLNVGGCSLLTSRLSVTPIAAVDVSVCVSGPNTMEPVCRHRRIFFPPWLQLSTKYQFFSGNKRLFFSSKMNLVALLHCYVFCDQSGSILWTLGWVENPDWEKTHSDWCVSACVFISMTFWHCCGVCVSVCVHKYKHGHMESACLPIWHLRKHSRLK